MTIRALKLIALTNTSFILVLSSFLDKPRYFRRSSILQWLINSISLVVLIAHYQEIYASDHDVISKKKWWANETIESQEAKSSKKKVSAIQQFIESEKTGETREFRCAFRGKIAKTPCKVSYINQYISDQRYIIWSGKPEITPVLTIKWGDGDESRYVWGDSGELMNLNDNTGSAFRQAGLVAEILEEEW